MESSEPGCPIDSADCDTKILAIPRTILRAEYEFCARRGLCDFDTGLCKCLEGWAGAACSVKSYVYSTSNAMPALSLSASGLDYVGNILQASTEKRVSMFVSFVFQAKAKAPGDWPRGSVYCACEPKYA